MKEHPKDGCLFAVKQPGFYNALREHGLTISELARQSGVSASMISEFASGKKSMTSQTFSKLRAVAPWLIDGTDTEGGHYNRITPDNWDVFKRRAELTKEGNRSPVYIKARIKEDVLHQLLLDKRWKLKDLAKQAEVSLQTVYNVCNGRTYPRMDTIRALSDALGVPSTELFDLMTE